MGDSGNTYVARTATQLATDIGLPSSGSDTGSQSCMRMDAAGTITVGNCDGTRRRRRLLSDGSYEEVDEPGDPGDEGLRAKVEVLSQSNNELKAKLERMEKLVMQLLEKQKKQ